jgi:hypothetical protein
VTWPGPAGSTPRRTPLPLRAWTEAERQLAEQLLPWGDCCECGARTQWRVVEREDGIPNGREWFVCGGHLPPAVPA